MSHLTLIPALIEVLGRRKYAGEIEPLPGAPFVRLHIPACETRSKDYDWSESVPVEEHCEFGDMVVDLGASSIFAITYVEADEVIEALSDAGSSVERGPLLRKTRTPVPLPAPQDDQEDPEPTEEEPGEAVLINGTPEYEFLGSIGTAERERAVEELLLERPFVEPPRYLPPEGSPEAVQYEGWGQDDGRAIEELIADEPVVPTAEQLAAAESLGRVLDLLGSGAPISQQIAAVREATERIDAVDDARAADLPVEAEAVLVEDLRPPVIVLPPPAPSVQSPPLSEWMQCAHVEGEVRCGREVRYLGATFCSDHAPVQAA